MKNFKKIKLQKKNDLPIDENQFRGVNCISVFLSASMSPSNEITIGCFIVENNKEISETRRFRKIDGVTVYVGYFLCLLWALKHLQKENRHNDLIFVYTNNDLFCRQMNGESYIKNDLSYVRYAFECARIVKQFNKMYFRYISKEENIIACNLTKNKAPYFKLPSLMIDIPEVIENTLFN